MASNTQATAILLLWRDHDVPFYIFQQNTVALVKQTTGQDTARLQLNRHRQNMRSVGSVRL